MGQPLVLDLITSHSSQGLGFAFSSKSHPDEILAAGTAVATAQATIYLSHYHPRYLGKLSGRPGRPQ